MNAKFGRKKNKAANISSDAVTNDQIQLSSPVQIGTSSQTGQSVTHSFAKTANEILTPDMSDIEKLQKIKEWILQDQHPYFNSAPKVAHLLSLRVAGADISSSGSGGDRDHERPISSIPLAERLSSPRNRMNGDFNDSQSQEANEGLSASADDRSSGQNRHGGQNVEENVDPNAPREDVDMADSQHQDPNGPVVTPTHPTGRGMTYPRSYNRPTDNQWKQERYPTGYGRRSPGADNDERRYAGDDPMRRPPSPSGRYDRYHDRFEAGSNAPGHYQQNNRRFSYNDRQQRNYGGDRDHANQGNYAPRSQDDRRMDDRGYTRPMGGPRNQNFQPGRGNYERRSDDQRSGQGTSQQHARDDSFEQPTSSAGLESHPLAQSEHGHEDEKDGIKTELDAPMLETKVTPTQASPVSPAIAPSQSGTDSVPVPLSPVKSETPQDVPFAPAQDEKMTEGNHSPRADVSVTGAEEIDIKQPETEQGNRPKHFQRHRSPMGRPRIGSFNKYPQQEHHNYDRSLPPRDDRNFERKDGYQRPGYTHPYPNNDRRFVAAYPDDPPYTSRREFQPQWDMKRRDDDVPFTKPFDYDRGRDFRTGGNAMPPRDMQPREMRDTRKGPPMGGARAYDVQPHEFSRRVGSRSPPPRALSPSGFRGYDRDYYAAPPPQAMAPMPGSYSREVPRVRPRSMSPVRRDFRPEERPPPAKRMRGPPGAYPANAPSGGHYGYQNQTMPNSRPHDYPHERRPIPAGPAAGTGQYYRNDNRGPMTRY